MILTFIEKDSYRIALSELNKLVKKLYCNSKYVLEIKTISEDFELSNFITIKLAWGLPDGSIWKTGQIEFDNNITLENLLARFEQLIIHLDEGE